MQWLTFVALGRAGSYGKAIQNGWNRTQLKRLEHLIAVGAGLAIQRRCRKRPKVRQLKKVNMVYEWVAKYVPYICKSGG